MKVKTQKNICIIWKPKNLSSFKKKEEKNIPVVKDTKDKQTIQRT